MVGYNMYMIETNKLQDKCWLWARAIDATGYGVLGLSIDGKRKKYLAHRVVYEALKGAIEKGYDVDHLCRARSCINPDHLEAVTHRENMRRGISPKWVAYNNGTCVKGHSKSNFYIRKDGQTAYCKICKMDKLKAEAKLRGNWNFNGRKAKNV